MCVCEDWWKLSGWNLRPIQYNKLSFHYFINPQCVNVFVYILLECCFACIIHIEDRTLNCVRWGNAFPFFYISLLHFLYIHFFTFIFHFRQYYVFYSLFLVYLYPIRWNIIFTPTHFHCWCAKSYGKIRAAVTTFFSLIFKQATTKHPIFISTLTFELNEILIIIGFSLQHQNEDYSHLVT